MTKIMKFADALGTVVVGTFKKVFTIMLLTAILAAMISTSIVLLVAHALS